MKTLLRYTWGGYIKHQGGRDGGDGAEQEGRKKLKRREGRNGTEERMIGTLKRGLREPIAGKDAFRPKTNRGLARG